MAAKAARGEETHIADAYDNAASASSNSEDESDIREIRSRARDSHKQLRTVSKSTDMYADVQR